MKMTFRWYGEKDSIPLSYIKQIPNMSGVVTAVYDVPVGEVWKLDKIKKLKSLCDNAGLEMEVIESVPVHEDIKLGKPTRDRLIANYAATIRNLGKEGVKCICYNFMPVFDWFRTNLCYKHEDGSTSLSYSEADFNKLDKYNLRLPGWDESEEELFADLKGVIFRNPEHGDVIGAKPYLMAGSDKKYAFRLATNEENLTVKVFESAIDLLSYATMLKDIGKDYRTENLISLSGIYLPKDQIEETKIPMSLEHYLATHPSTKKISLYLDNDFAGRRGADALQVITETHLEMQEDGSVVSVEYEVVKTYLYIDTVPMTKANAADKYGFDAKH